jgi:predicted dinucleotide-binding enzyme
LAVPYKAYPQLAQDFGKALTGKVVLDAGNASATRDGEELANEAKQSGIGPMSVKYFPGARLVRAFNSVGASTLARDAHREGALIGIPLAGDDRDALTVASGLVRDAGFEPVLVGGLDRAKDFQMGTPGFGQGVTAAELKKRLGL